MTTTFSDLGVPEAISDRLAGRGLDEAFEIQTLTVPDALAGRDLCGKAPTGSGKTIAFGIPLVARVRRSAPKRPKGLVLVPTRELAGQVAEELEHLGDHRVLAVYGGAPINPQIKKLRAGVDIIVACPGRLLDVMDRGACDLRDVDVVVLDEADRMADMGFLPSVRRILDETPADRQTLLFSATLDGAVDSLVTSYQRDPVVRELAEEKSGPVEHLLWTISDRPDKVRLTAEIIDRVGSTIVFSRTRHGADRLTRQLAKLGVDAAAIHGNRSQNQRERALASFHSGAVRALVATDVAARGIHVEDVRAVVHFDLPPDHKDYVHRSGRTGRAGSSGLVVGLVPEPERRAATKMLRKAGVDVEATAPDLDALPIGPAAPPRKRGDGSRSGAETGRSDEGRKTGRSAGRGRDGRSRGGQRSGRGPSGGGGGRPSGDRRRSADGTGDRTGARSGGSNRGRSGSSRSDGRGGQGDGNARRGGGRRSGSGGERFGGGRGRTGAGRGGSGGRRTG